MFFSFSPPYLAVLHLFQLELKATELQRLLIPATRKKMMSLLRFLFVWIDASIVKNSPFLFPESELVTEPEEVEEEEEEEREEERDTKEAEEEEKLGADCPSLADSKLSKTSDN